MRRIKTDASGYHLREPHAILLFLSSIKKPIRSQQRHHQSLKTPIAFDILPIRFLQSRRIFSGFIPTEEVSENMPDKHLPHTF